MNNTVDAQYEPFWNCPKCENRTDETDQDHIHHDNGERLDITCKHDVDSGGLEFESCNHKYSVNLNI